jgi:hypothetical protein
VEAKAAWTQGSFGIEGVSKGEMKRSLAITSEGNQPLYISVSLGWEDILRDSIRDSIRDNIELMRYYPVCEIISHSRDIIQFAR